MVNSMVYRAEGRDNDSSRSTTHYDPYISGRSEGMDAVVPMIDDVLSDPTTTDTEHRDRASNSRSGSYMSDGSDHNSSSSSAGTESGTTYDSTDAVGRTKMSSTS